MTPLYLLKKSLIQDFVTVYFNNSIKYKKATSAKPPSVEQYTFLIKTCYNQPSKKKRATSSNFVLTLFIFIKYDPFPKLCHFITLAKIPFLYT